MSFAQSFIGAEENPDAGMILTYGDDNYCQGYGKLNHALDI